MKNDAHLDASNASHDRYKVLLVEDDPVTQVFERVLLEEEGYAVEIRSNGAAALAALEQQTFDIILMDIQMPVMNGLEATHLIRSSTEPMRHTPIIAVTAYVRDKDRKRFLDAGMDDYIPKPVDQDEFLEVLSRNLPH